jgi:hypothetical protein
LKLINHKEKEGNYIMSPKQYAESQPKWLQDWLADMLTPLSNLSSEELAELDPLVEYAEKDFDGESKAIVLVRYSIYPNNADWESVYMEPDKAIQIYHAVCTILAEIYPDSAPLPYIGSNNLLH